MKKKLNLTKLRVLTQYNKQYHYNCCTLGIAGYLTGHISREIFLDTLRTQFHIRAQHPLISH